jgi:hypothetical protein
VNGDQASIVEQHEDRFVALGIRARSGDGIPFAGARDA